MKVAVLSRTESCGRRILEGCFVDDPVTGETAMDKAKKAKSDLLKRYCAPSRLCADTEIDMMEAQ